MTYPWAAGEVLLAADLNSALASKTDLAMTQNAQTGSSYSYALADASKLLTMSNAASNTVTVTKQATVTWVTGTQLRIMNLGAGVTTLVADTGVTINGNVSLKQYQGGTLIRTASDVWLFVPTASTQASATARVDTNQTTTSTSFTDLATAGPAVTLNTGTKAMVMVSSRLYHSSGGSACAMGFAVSGASTVAAVISSALIENSQSKTSYTTLVTGLTAGSNTFTAKYESQDPGTSNFQYREIFVVDMGS
jgi:hypothetical protein